MKTFLFSHFSFLKRSALLLGSLFLGQVLSAQTSSTLEPPAPHDSAYYARMQWFDNAKLGIFIHWGIYAVDGVSESWSFFNNNVPYDKYMAQSKGFTASNYNPAEWADLIKESGAQYTVITTKHHDGMALWNTKQSKLNVVNQTPATRDLITPFAEEVRKRGIHLGTYYSLLDWSHPDYPNHTRTSVRYDIKKDPARWQKFCKFNMAELNEVNTNWKPDLIWFDGDWEQTAETWNAPSVIKMLRKTNPNVIINSRIQGYGDYATPEIGAPVVRPKARYWELCYTINDSWGYQQGDTNFKSKQFLLTTFVDCLSKGGNLLLDITPKADGTIPQENIDVLKAFGRWTKKHAEAIYNTRAGVPGDYFIGYTTVNPQKTTLYLYLPYKPVEKVMVKGIVNNIKDIRVVGQTEKPTYTLYNKLSWSEVPGVLYIDVPERLLDENITVLALDLEGELKVYQGEGQVVTAN